MHALIADTFEQGQKAPVVRHTFVGKTPQKAEGFYRAHLKSDAFLRDCTEKGRFNSLRCKTKISVAQVTPRQLQALKTQQLAGVRGPEVGACPPPSFWRFASVVGAGQVAAFGIGFLLKHLLRNKHPRTADTITMVGSLGTFWLASGTAWVLLSRSKPDVRIEPEARATVPGGATSKGR